MKSLVGQKFGRLSVLEYVENKLYPSGTSVRYCRCCCECGKEKVVLEPDLKSGNTQSCGCLQRERVRASRIKDLTGQQFGRLHVVKYEGAKKEKNKVYHYWLCECECGNMKSINGSSLRRGLSRSCGCRQGRFIHGMWGKPGYKAHYLKDPIRKLKHVVGVGVRDALQQRKFVKYVVFGGEELMQLKVCKI